MLSILFEDNYILAINKPADLQVEADAWGNPSVERAVAEYFKTAFPWKKQLIVGIVHRLDRPASGILILAKTPLALKLINQQFEQRTVVKKYLALVEGKMPDDAGEIIDWLKKDSTERRAVVSTQNDAQAQESRLIYKVLETGKDKSLLAIELLTGRYHQIRAQLSARGCPIVGDKRYGSSLSAGEVICLHAHQLTFKHPKTGETMTIEAPPPNTGHWAWS